MSNVSLDLLVGVGLGVPSQKYVILLIIDEILNRTISVYTNKRVIKLKIQIF